MTSIISLVLCLIIVGILYKNMIAWEGDYDTGNTKNCIYWCWHGIDHSSSDILFPVLHIQTT